MLNNIDVSYFRHVITVHVCVSLPHSTCVSSTYGIVSNVEFYAKKLLRFILIMIIIKQHATYLDYCMSVFNFRITSLDIGLRAYLDKRSSLEFLAMGDRLDSLTRTKTLLALKLSDQEMMEVLVIPSKM